MFCCDNLDECDVVFILKVLYNGKYKNDNNGINYNLKIDIVIKVELDKKKLF